MSTVSQIRMEFFAKVVVPIALFVMGYYLINSVENALSERKLEVTSASAISELLNKLHSDVGQSEANAAALTLAAYGEAAIVPLIGTIEYGSPQTESAATRALFMIGLEHPKEVSEVLAEVLDKRHRQFDARVHQIAIIVLGQIGDTCAKKTLLNYRDVLARRASDGLEDWQAMVRGAKVENYNETRDEMVRALASLGIDWTPSP
jgi:HEAT repeat protein